MNARFRNLILAIAEILLENTDALDADIAECQAALNRDDDSTAVKAMERIDSVMKARRVRIRKVVKVAQKEICGLLQIAHEQTREADARRIIIKACADIEGIPRADGSLDAIKKILRGVEVVNSHFSSTH
jgi:hypothetical protein